MAERRRGPLVRPGAGRRAAADLPRPGLLARPGGPRRLGLGAHRPGCCVADDDRLDRIAEAFARVIDAKSPFTARHSERVAEIAVGIGDLLGFDAVTRRDLRRAGLLHDVGKLADLQPDPRQAGQAHRRRVLEGQGAPGRTRCEILGRAPCFAPIADLAANHHERIDGTGYPRGLARRRARPADARARRGRRLRGAHGRPPLPRAAAGGEGARHRLLGGPGPARPRRVRGARAPPRPQHRPARARRADHRRAAR